jgi:hypothetical protein
MIPSVKNEFLLDAFGPVPKKDDISPLFLLSFNILRTTLYYDIYPVSDLQKKNPTNQTEKKIIHHVQFMSFGFRTEHKNLNIILSVSVRQKKKERKPPPLPFLKRFYGQLGKPNWFLSLMLNP